MNIEKERFDLYGNIAFADSEHKEAFLKVLGRMGVMRDPYYVSLAYLITLDRVCREHTDDIFNFKDMVIRSQCLKHSWQTGTSKKTTLLAFNLFCGGYSWCPNSLKRYCVPDEIFCSSLAPFYCEALRIRFCFDQAVPEPDSTDEPEAEETLEVPERPLPLRSPAKNSDYSLSICMCCHICTNSTHCGHIMKYDCFSNTPEALECRNCNGDGGCCSRFKSAFEDETVFRKANSDDEMPF